MLVRKSEKKFTVDKEILRKSSPFFDAACKRDWKEGEEGVVRLTLVEPLYFRVYANWVYGVGLDPGTVDAKDIMDAVGFGWWDKSLDEREKGYVKLWLLIALYIAGDVLGDTKFQDAVLDALLPRVRDNTRGLDPHAISMAWERTVEGCTLRRLILDALVIYPPRGGLKEGPSRYPPDFLFALCNRQINVRSDIERDELQSTTYDKCQYHQHDKGEECLADELERPGEEYQYSKTHSGSTYRAPRGPISFAHR